VFTGGARPLYLVVFSPSALRDSEKLLRGSSGIAVRVLQCCGADELGTASQSTFFKSAVHAERDVFGGANFP